MSASGISKLHSCSFEVFGRVQGVYFRKHTEKAATRLGVKGWCMNTKTGTVKGELEAPLPELNEMKDWLQTTGSPQSMIEKAEFSQCKEISSGKYTKFEIRR